MDYAVSDNAHYAVPGKVISQLVRMIYILADRDEKARTRLVALAKKLVTSPLIKYDEESAEDTYSLRELLKLSGTYIDSKDEGRK